VTRPDWAPDQIDLDLPSPARVHDFLLGGTHHVPADRRYAEELTATAPELAHTVRAQRAFLGRAVRYLVEAGVRQFVDLGSGLPTQGSTHEVAQRLDPASRVVYVDLDPAAVAHGRAILDARPDVAMVTANLCEPAEVLASRPFRALIRMDEPVAFLLVGMVSAVPHPEDVVAGYTAAAAPDSHVVLADVAPGPAELAALLDDLAIVAPGAVPVESWRPDSGAVDAAGGFAAVGRKDDRDG